MYLNIVELAESLGVEERTVHDWIRNEQLPHVLDRGRLLFDRHQVVSWAAARGLASKAGFLAEKHSTTGIRLGALLERGGVWRDVASSDVLNVLEQVVRRGPSIASSAQEILLRRLRASDGINWAAVGNGIALPHLRAPVVLGRESGLMAALFLRDALPIEAPDSRPIMRLLFFIAPSPRAHLDILAAVSRALSGGQLEKQLIASADDAAILDALASPNSKTGLP